MLYPANVDSMKYENDSFSIKFKLYPTNIGFTLVNKLPQGIKINWDELSVSINGKANRVVHKETAVLKQTEVQPPTTVPPFTKLDDGLVPAGNAIITSGYFGNKVSLVDIFPSNDYGNKRTAEIANSYKGSDIIIYMPLYINNQFVSKYYTIRITDVVKK
jgi:hypothetical protein